MNDYEYLIVGAGSGGAAVAARLVERGHSVLLVEAGPDWRSEMCPPELRSPWSNFAWTVDTIPPEFQWLEQRATRQPGGEEYSYLRGRGLGGSSLVNGMMAVRPPLSEFDIWESRGIRGWSRKDVLERFNRLETDVDHGREAFHGEHGPIPISRLPEEGWGTLDHVLRSASLQVGHEWVDDHNTPEAVGVSRTASSIRLGVRVSANDAYLDGLRENPGLTVITDTLVDRVLFDSAGAAVGVQALRHGETIQLHGTEVILAGGAVMSPAILQRSGIGPASVLRNAGVDIRADLPVGLNAQDHAGFQFRTQLTSASSAFNGTRGNVTLRWNSGLDEDDAADLHLAVTNPANSKDLSTGFLIKLAHTTSRGRVAISSADPHEPPTMELGLLTDERDRALARLGFRQMVELLGTDAYLNILHSVTDVSGQKPPLDGSNSEIDAWLDRFVVDTAHISSTTPMGPISDPTAVLDSEARVHGISRLRVADLSVTPSVPRANTNLTAFMIGERVADFLSNVDET